MTKKQTWHLNIKDVLQSTYLCFFFPYSIQFSTQGFSHVSVVKGQMHWKRLTAHLLFSITRRTSEAAWGASGAAKSWISNDQIRLLWKEAGGCQSDAQTDAEFLFWVWLAACVLCMCVGGTLGTSEVSLEGYECYILIPILWCRHFKSGARTAQ